MLKQLKNFHTIDCRRPSRTDYEVLSSIFTETVIRKCFDVSMRTEDTRKKQAACEFVNLLCGVDYCDVTCADGQCECLISSITV